MTPPTHAIRHAVRFAGFSPPLGAMARPPLAPEDYLPGYGGAWFLYPDQARAWIAANYRPPARAVASADPRWHLHARFEPDLRRFAPGEPLPALTPLPGPEARP